MMPKKECIRDFYKHPLKDHEIPRVDMTKEPPDDEQQEERILQALKRVNAELARKNKPE